jgi:putative glutamine amidotransferase
MEKKLIKLDNPEIVGIYYADENYDYTVAERYIVKNKLKSIHLHKIPGNLTLTNLFQKNQCSDQFYTVFKNSDGLVFFGGPDIPPVVYGQKTNLLTSITDSYRHFFELSLLFHLLGGSQNSDFKPWLDERPAYVIYGFCLGLQTMNVATGGTLWQDIPTEIYGLQCAEDILQLPNDMQHGNYYKNLWEDDDISWGKLHAVKFVANKPITKILNVSENDKPMVSSSHHQSIKSLGQGWDAVAFSTDGKIIEAITHLKYKNVLGVQFHPERSDLYEPETNLRLRHEDTGKISFTKQMDAKSIAFHRIFWEHFSELFSSK